MIAADINPLWVLVGSFITAFLTYLGLRLKNSGSVRTSPPEVIFEAGEQVRHELVERLQALKVDLSDVKAEFAAYRVNATAREKELQTRVSQLQTRVSHLEDELFNITQKLRREEKRNGTASQ